MVVEEPEDRLLFRPSEWLRLCLCHGQCRPSATAVWKKPVCRSVDLIDGHGPLLGVRRPPVTEANPAPMQGLLGQGVVVRRHNRPEVGTAGAKKVVVTILSLVEIATPSSEE